MNEAVFSVWDTDANGLVDCIEFFTGMIVFAACRVEDKLRFLIDFFDFNENGFLHETELSFMCYNVLTATAKVFGCDVEMPSFPNSSGESAFDYFEDLLRMTFAKDTKIGPKELIRWVVESPELRAFFVFIEKMNGLVN